MLYVICTCFITIVKIMLYVVTKYLVLLGLRGGAAARGALAPEAEAHKLRRYTYMYICV